MAILVVRRQQQLARPDLRRQLAILGQHRFLVSILRLVLERWLRVRRTCRGIFNMSTTI